MLVKALVAFAVVAVVGTVLRVVEFRSFPKYDTWTSPDGRVVRIWYTRHRLRVPTWWGEPPWRVALTTGGIATTAGVIGLLLLAIPTDALDDLGWWIIPGALILCGLSVVFGVCFVRAVLDYGNIRHIRGRLMRVTLVPMGEDREIHAPWMAVDPGDRDIVRALRINQRTYERLIEGSDVEVRATAWLHNVRDVTVVRLPEPVNTLPSEMPRLPIDAAAAEEVLGMPVELAVLEYAHPELAVDGIRAFQYLPLRTRATGWRPDRVEIYLVDDASLADRLVTLVALNDRGGRPRKMRARAGDLGLTMVPHGAGIVGVRVRRANVPHADLTHRLATRL